MSRRNRANRFIGHHDSQANSSGSAAPLVIVEETDDDDNTSFVGKIGEFCGGCWEKTATCCTSAVSATWNGLCKIPSYCVIRWDSEEEDGRREPATVSPNTAPNTPLDPDELLPSRWWNLGIKTAAVAVAALILVGGYFVVKPLLFNTPTEVAEVEIEAESANEPADAEQHAQLPGGQLPTFDAPPTETFVPPPVPPAPPAFAQAPPPPAVEATPLLQPEPPIALPPQDPIVEVPFAAVAEVAPPIADPFAAMPMVAEPPPALANESAPSLAALQPLAQPQLQPLAALNVSGFPSATVDNAAPAPVAATASPAIAGNRSPQRNAGFTQPPTAPPVNTLPQTPVQPTIALVEPIREVVPQIPSSGTVQDVPPPIIPPTPIAEVAPVMHPNESAPAIPSDAAIAATPVILDVSVPAAPAPAAVPVAEAAPRIVPLDSQPLDWELWEQIREIRNETESAPSPLRFENAATTSEPVLRFTPREAPVIAESADTENSFMDDAMSQFSALMPAGEPGPNVGNIDSFLPLMDEVPQPIVAEPSQAYRDVQVADRGMTFQSRIDSEISRSPSATETYIVQEGDTYMTISDRFYGTSLLYTALAQHNQKLGISWRPAMGVVIEVPTAEFLRMNYGAATHHAERRLDTQRQGMRYIVQEGDTVFRLATDRLQDSTRWREIYALNADRIQDVRELQPGMEILLPVATGRLNQQNHNF